MAREKIIEEVMQDGSIKVTAVFLATSKAKSPLSSSGKMLNGYASGFMTLDSGAKINIVYGWGTGAPKQAQAPKPVTVEASL